MNACAKREDLQQPQFIFKWRCAEKCCPLLADNATRQIKYFKCFRIFQLMGGPPYTRKDTICFQKPSKTVSNAELTHASPEFILKKISKIPLPRPEKLEDPCFTSAYFRLTYYVKL